MGAGDLAGDDGEGLEGLSLIVEIVIGHRHAMGDAMPGADQDSPGFQPCRRRCGRRRGRPVSGIDAQLAICHPAGEAAFGRRAQAAEGVLLQASQRGTFERAAGHAVVVIAVVDQDPALGALAGDERLAGLALGVERVELHVELFLARLPCITVQSARGTSCLEGTGCILQQSGHGRVVRHDKGRQQLRHGSGAAPLVPRKRMDGALLAGQDSVSPESTLTRFMAVSDQHLQVGLASRN